MFIYASTHQSCPHQIPKFSNSTKLPSQLPTLFCAKYMVCVVTLCKQFVQTQACIQTCITLSCSFRSLPTVLEWNYEKCEITFIRTETYNGALQLHVLNGRVLYNSNKTTTVSMQWCPWKSSYGYTTTIFWCKLRL